MFSKEIVGSDAFQDMPASSQLLYFHLGMEADDDGFIGNPKKIARGIGVAEDDMKILVAKRFVIIFDSGVLVIKHHRINNNFDKYNCKRTMYIEEFKQLYIKENKAYTLDKNKSSLNPDCNQTESRLKTVFRREEKRIDKNRIDINTLSASADHEPKETNFDIFWEAYPKKELKSKAREIWKRKKLDSSLEIILAFVEKASKTDRWQSGYIKQPTTFLNGNCWEDDLESYKNRQPESTQNYYNPPPLKI